MRTAKESLRPADVCKALLAALEASEGRKRKHKRDQTPDTIGLSIKRSLLERAMADDPEPEAFAEWLFRCPIDHDAPHPPGAVSAMARASLHEWRLAHASHAHRAR